MSNNYLEFTNVFWNFIIIFGILPFARCELEDQIEFKLVRNDYPRTQYRIDV